LHKFPSIFETRLYNNTYLGLGVSFFFESEDIYEGTQYGWVLVYFTLITQEWEYMANWKCKIYGEYDYFLSGSYLEIV
jgi:hypothetical protein